MWWSGPTGAPLDVPCRHHHAGVVDRRGNRELADRALPVVFDALANSFPAGAVRVPAPGGSGDGKSEGVDVAAGRPSDE